MKHLRLLAVLALICLLFCSCGASRYTGAYSPSELTSTLKKENSAFSDYREYSGEDISLMLDTADAESFSVIYSADGDDIGEIGIFRVREGEDTDDMLGELKKYIESVRESRTQFVKNYIPSEMPKLDGAQVLALGRYACYCILDSESAKIVFDKLKVILME